MALIRFILILTLIASAFSQTSLNGIVLNSQSGEPVPGADIIIPGSTEGSATDSSGRFTLDTSGEFPLTLQVSHIGYARALKQVQAEGFITIDLWPTTLELDPVDISVVRLPSHYDVSSPRESVSSAQLRTRAIQDFQEITRSVSSVIVSAGMDGSQTVSIRGSNANETPIYLDGVKINDSFTNVADLSLIDMDDIDNIEVIKGAATLPYEVGAFGGVINLYSVMPTRPELNLNVSRDVQAGEQGQVSGRFGYLMGPVSVSLQHSNQNRDYSSFLGNVATQRTFSSAFINMDLGLGSLRAKAIRQSSETESDFDAFAVSTLNSYANLRYSGGLPRLGDEWLIDLGLRDGESSDRWSLGTSNPLYEQSPNGNNRSLRVAKLFGGDITESLLQYSLLEDSYSGPSSTAIPPIFEKRTDLDLQRSISSLTAIGKYNIKPRVSSIKQVTLEGGLRYDDAGTDYVFDELRSYYREGEDTPHRTEQELREETQDRYLVSKRLGVRLDGKTDRLSYVAFLSQGNNYRLPTLQDVYRKEATTVFYYNSLTLDKEIVNTSEVGVDLSFLFSPGMPFYRFEGSLHYFKNAYINKITYAGVPGQPPIPYNTLAADIRGIEFNGRLHFLSKRGGLNLSSTFLDLSDPFVFAGKPSYRHTLGFDMDRGRYTFAGNFWINGKTVLAYEDGTYQELRSDLDLSVSSEWDTEHALSRLTLSAKNILNYDSTRESAFVNEQGYLMTYFDEFQLVLALNVSLR